MITAAVVTACISLTASLVSLRASLRIRRSWRQLGEMSRQRKAEGDVFMAELRANATDARVRNLDATRQAFRNCGFSDTEIAQIVNPPRT